MRVTCLKCRQTYEPSKQELTYLFGKSYHNKDIKLYRGTGCDSCYHTGYHGRKSIYEILSISPKIRRMIVNRNGDLEIKQQAIEEGMKTLYESAVKEVLNCVTTAEELTRIVDVGAE
jgi:type IV pilus assembly protein PilB